MIKPDGTLMTPLEEADHVASRDELVYSTLAWRRLVKALAERLRNRQDHIHMLNDKLDALESEVEQLQKQLRVFSHRNP